MKQILIINSIKVELGKLFVVFYLFVVTSKHFSSVFQGFLNLSFLLTQM